MTGHPPSRQQSRQQQPAPDYHAAGSPYGYGPRGPADDRMWAMLAYLLAIVAHLVAPLVIYLVKMNESGYVRYHAAQSLNLAITMISYLVGSLIIGLVLGILTGGAGFFVIILLFAAIVIGDLVFLVLAALAANRGELYSIPAYACLPIVH